MDELGIQRQRRLESPWISGLRRGDLGECLQFELSLFERLGSSNREGLQAGTEFGDAAGLEKRRAMQVV